MADETVTRLRVSYVSSRVHDSLVDQLADEAEFVDRLVDPRPVAGLEVSLPFGAGTEIDALFWGRIAERHIATPVAPDLARRMRRACIPLRWRGELVASATVPRLEAHLHRFGIATLVTVDVEWSSPVLLEESWHHVGLIERAEATARVSGVPTSAALRDISGKVLSELLSKLARGESKTNPAASEHRLTTVISGSRSGSTAELPAANGPMHVALHRLAGGRDVIASPGAAFVPVWSGAGYVFSPASLTYSIEGGSAILSSSALTQQAPPASASALHRERLLMCAYTSALSALARSAPSSPSGPIRAWAKLAAQMLGRLYGPSADFLSWGKFPSALLDRSGSSAAVRDLTGAALTPNPDYPAPKYGS